MNAARVALHAVRRLTVASVAVVALSAHNPLVTAAGIGLLTALAVGSSGDSTHNHNQRQEAQTYGHR